MKLSSILKDRSNGLTQSRVLLALLVLLDHQYVLFQVSKPPLLSGALTVSAFAVYMFIFMSGLLCYFSRSRNNVAQFMLLRISRIFPGYVACLAFTSILFIPFLALLNLQDGGNPAHLFPATIRASLEYFFGNLALTQNIYLPASLHLANPIPAINGSLWTLQPEIMGYLLIAILFPILSLLPGLFGALLLLGTLCMATVPGHLRAILTAALGGYGFETATDSHLYLAIYLLSGIVFALYASRIDLNAIFAGIAAFSLVLAHLIDVRLFNILCPLALPYLFIYACWVIPWPWGSGVDWSYGVYLYSFPLQQIAWGLQARHLIAKSFGTSLVIVALLSLACGALSYHLVEHPARLRILAMVRPKGR